MTTRTTSKTSSGQSHVHNDKQPTPHWFSRYRKPTQPASQVRSGGDIELHAPAPVGRPGTAPSTGTATTAPPMPPMPPMPQFMAMERLPAQKNTKAPPRPQRPDAGVLRDVNAWLDASKPSSPLMGGLPYWRDGAPGVHVGEGSNVQYTIPVVHEPEDEPASASSGQQLKLFCRRAKKMQVRMPSLQRTRSQRPTILKINRRSDSTPVIGLPYEQTRECSPPRFLVRLKSTRRPATASNIHRATDNPGYVETGHGPFIDISGHRGSPASEGVGCLERHFNATASQRARTGDWLRPVPVTGLIPREDSMGSMSDAPTYFSGPPPPSYRSRTASILTTSSFGCVDGMNPEYRQLSQQRAQEKRSVKGKLKKFAQKCALTK